MKQVLLRLRAFLWRDLRATTSYRLLFFLRLAQIASGIFMYFFLSRVSGTIDPSLTPYKRDFFSFLLVGLAFWGLFNNALIGALNSIRNEQRSGTLEALLTTPTPAPLLILGGMSLPLLIACGEVFLYLAGGSLFFNVNWAGANWPAAILLLVLSTLHGAAIGLLIAALIVVTKRGDQIVWLLISGLSLLVGIFYPITVLPAPLQAVAGLLPLTQALQALRLALFGGTAAGDIGGTVLMLAASTLVLGFVGSWALERALDYARQEGSLAQF